MTWHLDGVMILFFSFKTPSGSHEDTVKKKCDSIKVDCCISHTMSELCAGNRLWSGGKRQNVCGPADCRLSLEWWPMLAQVTIQSHYLLFPGSWGLFGGWGITRQLRWALPVSRKLKFYKWRKGFDVGGHQWVLVFPSLQAFFLIQSLLL